MTMQKVNRFTFSLAFGLARSCSKLIRDNTSDTVPKECTYFLDFTPLCEPYGFVISAKGELTNVFSEAKGMGDTIVKSAIANGATHLDCFEGYLSRLYRKHSFVVRKTVPNWTEGRPNVVYMRLWEGKV